MKYRITVVQEMAFSQSCQFEIEAEPEDEAKDEAYERAFNGEPEWDPNPAECVGWHMEVEAAA